MMTKVTVFVMVVIVDFGVNVRSPRVAWVHFNDTKPIIRHYSGDANMYLKNRISGSQVSPVFKVEIQ